MRIVLGLHCVAHSFWSLRALHRSATISLFRILIMKIDHIAIAVDDIQKAIALFSELLDIEFGEPELVESQQTLVAFAEIDNCKLELVEAASASSPLFPILPHPVKKFVERHGWGLHHIAFTTSKLGAEAERLESLGFRLLSEKQLEGAETAVHFVDPNTTGGVLIEFCQKKER